MATTEVEKTQSLYGRATFTAKTIRNALPLALQTPKVAIVCGSGLGGLAETVDPLSKVEISYDNVPGFPASTGIHLNMH